MIDMVHPEDRAITLQTVDYIVADQPQPHFENRYIRKDGRVVHIMWSARWSEADQCRVAVARDITQRKQDEARQQAVYAISEASHRAENMHSLFEQVHSIIDALLPAKNIAIALLDPQTDTICLPYSVTDAAQSGSLLDVQSLCAQIVHSGRPVCSQTDQQTESTKATTKAITKSTGTAAVSWLGVPLTTRTGTIGALLVHSQVAALDTPGYSESDQRLLQFVSTQIATAVERKRLLANLQRAALYDQLTQLPNRALLHDRLDSALVRAERNEEQLSLIYLDLDKFKDVNDTYGHAAGDVLLERVARRIESCVRKSDTVARLGGDEFVVLVENVSAPGQSEKIADKIRHVLCQPFALSDCVVAVEPSLGIAHYPAHGTNKAELLNHADQAMYADKGLRRAKDQIE